MKVLITNLFASGNSGSETVVELLADGLRRAGHQVMLLAPTLGEMSDRMRTRGHVVVARIAELTERPDVIHAQHLTPCLTALARFPNVPAVFSCHSSLFEVEAPMLHPQIRQWIAVDDACKIKCLSRGVPADRLSVVYNAVDLERFKARLPLPDRPRRGLLLTKNREHQVAIRQLCASANIELDELGPATGRISLELQHDLLSYDIVFATARMAIEAAAVGCAVVVCDARGFAGLLQTANMEEWRRMNLGAGILAKPTTYENLQAAISKYDANDAAKVSQYFRSVAGEAYFIQEHIRIYESAIEDRFAIDQDERSLATSKWIEEIAVTREPRKWISLASELSNAQKPHEVELLDLVRSNTKLLQDNSSGLTKIVELTSEISNTYKSELEILNITKLASQASAAEYAELRKSTERVSVVAEFVDELKRLYNGIVPLFLRKLILRARRRS